MNLKRKKIPLPEVPRYHRIELPCGFAFASVSKDIKPETIKALDEMAKAALRMVNAKTGTKI